MMRKNTKKLSYQVFATLIFSISRRFNFFRSWVAASLKSEFDAKNSNRSQKLQETYQISANLPSRRISKSWLKNMIARNREFTRFSNVQTDSKDREIGMYKNFVQRCTNDEKKTRKLDDETKAIEEKRKEQRNRGAKRAHQSFESAAALWQASSSCPRAGGKREFEAFDRKLGDQRPVFDRNLVQIMDRSTPCFVEESTSAVFEAPKVNWTKYVYERQVRKIWFSKIFEFHGPLAWFS